MSDVEYDDDFAYDEGIADDFGEIEDPDTVIETVEDVADLAPEDPDAEEPDFEPEDDYEEPDELEDADFAVLEDPGDAELTRDYIYNKSVKPQAIRYIRAWEPAAMVFTSNTMSLYEFTRVLAIRTKDISLHSGVYTDCTDIVDAEQRARKELKDRRCPLIVERTTAMQDGVKVIEAFRVRDMNIPFL
jgi:hypothetical protein